MSSDLFKGEVVAHSGSHDIVFHPGYFADGSGGFFYEGVQPGTGSGVWGDIYHFKLIYNDERRGDELTPLGKNLLAGKVSDVPVILWDYFGTIPVDPVTEEVDGDFMAFPKGTPKEAVLRWFEKTFKGFRIA